MMRAAFLAIAVAAAAALTPGYAKAADTPSVGKDERLVIPSCPERYPLKWNGTQWTCNNTDLEDLRTEILTLMNSARTTLQERLTTFEDRKTECDTQTAWAITRRDDCNARAAECEAAVQ